MKIRYLARANYGMLKKTPVQSGKSHSGIDGDTNNSAHPLKSAAHRNHETAQASTDSVVLSPCRCVRVTPIVLLGTTSSAFEDTPALMSELVSLPTRRGVIDAESVVVLRLSTKEWMTPFQFLACLPRTKAATG